MARFGFNERDNYTNNTSSYFSLKDDGDTARVRLLYNDINDVKGVSVHQIKVDDRTIDVECIRSYNEPVHNCPLCAAGHKLLTRIYVPVYDIASKESKIWTRGTKFFDKLSSLCRYNNPLVGTIFEIERFGKKGDTQTSYEFNKIGNSDDSRVEDFPKAEAENVAFQVKTYEELETYTRTGTFGNKVTENRTERRESREVVNAQAPIRRRPNYDEEDNF